MAEKRILSRLLRLREIQEEQSRVALEAKVVQRDQLEHLVVEACQRQVQGRFDFIEAINEDNRLDRSGGLLEIEAAGKLRTRLAAPMAAAKLEADNQRAEFLARRRERRQVETLLEQAHGLAEREHSRKAQQMLDDWYGRRGAGPRTATVLRSCNDSGQEWGEDWGVRRSEELGEDGSQQQEQLLGQQADSDENPE